MNSDRKRDPESTRHAILDAAEHLFLSKGFAETSTSEIAGLAGVNKSLIHHHFGSKDGVWDEIKRRIFSVYHTAQKDLLENLQSSEELLKTSLISYFQFLASRPEFARMMCMMYLADDSSCDDLAHELMHLGVAKIAEAQEGGFLRADLQPLHILISFLSLVEHWFLCKDHIIGTHFPEKAAEGDTALDQAYLIDLAKIFFEGVRAT